MVTMGRGQKQFFTIFSKTIRILAYKCIKHRQKYGSCGSFEPSLKSLRPVQAKLRISEGTRKGIRVLGFRGYLKKSDHYLECLPKLKMTLQYPSTNIKSQNECTPWVVRDVSQVLDYQILVNVACLPLAELCPQTLIKFFLCVGEKLKIERKIEPKQNKNRNFWKK